MEENSSFGFSAMDFVLAKPNVLFVRRLFQYAAQRN